VAAELKAWGGGTGEPGLPQLSLSESTATGLPGHQGAS
jgi:hypothetical protein